MIWTAILLLFGFALLVKSADYFVDGAAGIAKRFKIPEIVVGMTLVAFGTSAPELSVSLIAAFQGNADLTIGNILGSNIANIALILGFIGVMGSVKIQPSTVTRGLPLNILASMVILIFGYDLFFQNHGVVFNRYTLGDGLVLLCFFVVFLYYIYADTRAGKAEEEKIEHKEKEFHQEKIYVLISLIVGGLMGVVVGGKLVVDNAIEIARLMGLSQAFIGLTIVAIGTSLPELVTSLVATHKRQSDIAVGNIIGSNIFNVFLVLGLTSTFKTISFDPKLLLDGIFLFFISILLFLFTIQKKELRRSYGIILLVLYVFYVCALIFRERI